MVLSGYDINRIFTSRRIFLIMSKYANTAAWIKNKLSFIHIKTGIVAKLNLNLTTTYYATEGILKHINDRQEDFPKERALRAYNSAAAALSTFRKIYGGYEKANFFNYIETQELSEGVLNNLYDIEAALRSQAFSTSETIPEDQHLTKIASSLSYNSL